MNISGLSSGTDWDNVIEQLMYVEQAPIRNWQARQEDLTTEKNAWQDINSRLLSLKNKTDDLLSVTTFDKMSATSSNSDVVTATASISAQKMSHTIKVKELAASHQARSDQQLGSWTAAANATFTLNGTAVDITAGATLDEVAAAINGASYAADEDVSASVVDNILVITEDRGGAGNTMTLSDTAGSLMTDLGMITAPDTFKTVLQAPTDATFNVDGIEVTRSKNTGLTDVITGVTLNLQGVSTKSGAEAWPGDYASTTLNIATDVDTIYSSIEAWVEQYNSSISFIRDETHYDSETDTAGTLVGNTSAVQIVNNLTQKTLDRYSDLSSQYSTLAEIGITLGEYGSEDADLLTIDSAKLQAALEDNPTWVQDLFGKDTDADYVKDYGIAASIKNHLDPLVQFNGMIDNQENSLQAAIDGLDDRISSYENILDLRERNLRQTYTNLEVSLAQFSNTSDWLSGQLAGLNG